MRAELVAMPRVVWKASDEGVQLLLDKEQELKALRVAVVQTSPKAAVSKPQS